MLMLSRRRGEVVRITCGAETCRVQVVRVKDGQVRLGFDASRSVNVVREELLSHGDTDPIALVPVPEEPSGYRHVAEQIERLAVQWLENKSDGLDVLASDVADQIRGLLDGCEGVSVE